jgi:putative DNA primase/helicase
MIGNALPPPVINCANAEVWISPDGTVDLRPHRPESHLRHCLDVTYDPEATCPTYDRAVREIFAKADNPKAMVRHWNECWLRHPTEAQHPGHRYHVRRR